MCAWSCVCDNDNLTLNWTSRGAGLMLKHIQGQQLSPCLRSVCGVWIRYCLCVFVWQIVYTCICEYQLQKITRPHHHIFPVLLWFFLPICMLGQHLTKCNLHVFVVVLCNSSEITSLFSFIPWPPKILDSDRLTALESIYDADMFVKKKLALYMILKYYSTKIILL